MELFGGCFKQVLGLFSCFSYGEDEGRKWVVSGRLVVSLLVAFGSDLGVVLGKVLAERKEDGWRSEKWEMEMNFLCCLVAVVGRFACILAREDGLFGRRKLGENNGSLLAVLWGRLVAVLCRFWGRTDQWWRTHLVGKNGEFEWLFVCCPAGNGIGREKTGFGGTLVVFSLRMNSEGKRSEKMGALGGGLAGFRRTPVTCPKKNKE
ncbi:hypothetical protein KY284_007859 [Solanum tuberosum]|nr:hypothetical protein KY284_007859 [Solanum tuberosum]